ncbi:MAG: DUF4132 domain-containing protein [Alphaproteobacteria bacterium]|nr:DUF4132 domain-containing protein [Alphaproteobacteria bacterium]
MTVAGNVEAQAVRREVAPGPEEIAALRSYFSRLSAVEKGLDERVVQFVLGNGNEDVSEVISKERTAVKEALSNDYCVINKSEEGTPNAKRWSSFRQAFMKFAIENDLPMAARIAQVLFWFDSYVIGGRHFPLEPTDPRRFLDLRAFLHIVSGYFGERREHVTADVVAFGADRLGCSNEDLLLAVYTSVKKPSREIKGFETLLVERAGDIAAAAASHADVRQRLVQDLADLGLVSGEYLELAFDLACSKRKTTAKSGFSYLQSADRSELVQLLLKKLGEKSVVSRKVAVQALLDSGGEEAQTILQAHRKKEKQASVKSAIDAALAQLALKTAGPATAKLEVADLPEGSTVIEAIDGSPIVIPPVPPMPASQPLGDDHVQLLRDAFAKFNSEMRLYLSKAQKPASYMREIEVEAIENTVSYLQDGDMSTRPVHGIGYAFSRLEPNSIGRDLPGYDGAEIKAFAGGVFNYQQSLRLSIAVNMHGIYDPLGMLARRQDEIYLAPLIGHLENGADFRQYAAFLAVQGKDEEEIVRDSLSYQYGVPEPLWDTVFYFFLEHLEVFEEALGARPQRGSHQLSADAALELLEMWPAIPASLAPALIEFGLTGHKLHRERARALLANGATVDDALIARLADNKKDVRATAAYWIGERRNKAAEPALRKILKKEKGEENRAAVLTALARIGADISDQFSARVLGEEARKGLTKTKPKDLGWFPFAAVPKLRWKGGTAIPDDIVKWWIVLADKLKSPGGNALFDLYLERVEEEDAAAFGLFLLDAFIERDTQSPSREEALERATKEVDRWLKSISTNHNINRAQHIEGTASRLMGQQAGCSQNRGILGLTRYAPGHEAGERVRRYLKDNGNKVNQSKALLTALARNPSPAAIQVVLAVSHRLRQKTTQALARELVEGIAEERGWSADELADRTIPTGGFDETCEMVLDCGGGRTFRANYRGEGKIELVNADGKKVKALPKPKGEDDKELNAIAKKAFSTARKEVKQVLTLQRSRLYEAMCVERIWSPDIWTTFLKPHPIVGQLCQGLIWLGLDEAGQISRSFRILNDGTLTNNRDEDCDLDGVHCIKLAHQVLLEQQEVEAWMQHLKDYEVEPLFDQFGKPVEALSDPNAMHYDGREGYVVDNMQLASLTGKLGYERGEVVDAGGFTEYVKRFPGAGYQAVFSFTGSYVGATEKFACGLEKMSYQKLRNATAKKGRPVPLGEVPKVLYAETICDLHTIAAAGSGFDADWKSRCQY